jgi:thymidylate synthase
MNFNWIPNLFRGAPSRVNGESEASPLDRYVTVGTGVSDVTHQVLRKQLTIAPVVPSRNGETRELSPHTVVVQGGSPYTILPNRGNNVLATIAETLWVWAGRKDLSHLIKWLPRASEYSDDWNQTTKEGNWRAGYGPRLRAWNNRDGSVTDQLEVVVGRLQRSLETRQALFAIYDPAADSVAVSKDYPCNLIVHFLVRDGALNMHTYLRSNDVVFGYCINAFEWTFIWKYLADKLGIGLGSYHHTASSLHLYKHHYDKAAKIVDTYRAHPSFLQIYGGFGKLTPEALKKLCDRIFECGGREIVDEEEIPSFLRDFSVALFADNTFPEHDVEGFMGLMNQIRDKNLILAMLDLGQRRFASGLWSHPSLPQLFPLESDYAEVTSFLRYLDGHNAQSRALKNA